MSGPEIAEFACTYAMFGTEIAYGAAGKQPPQAHLCQVTAMWLILAPVKSLRNGNVADSYWRLSVWETETQLTVWGG
eukprot:3625602-Rhodomonas_salina.1